MVAAPDYPCVGAKSVFRRGAVVIRDFGTMDAPEVPGRLLTELGTFATEREGEPEFSSFIAVFSADAVRGEQDFEDRLWRLLQAVHYLDPAPWPQTVSSDPADAHFSWSAAGTSWFIVGLNPAASRAARRTPWPAAVFNLHSQFEALRASGRFERMRSIIRRRDAAYDGSVNPNVSDHGEASEARQYSGRAVEPEWVAPFNP